jgi:hypothetical protein
MASLNSQLTHTAVYATNLLDPPSWYRVARTCSKEYLLNLSYIAVDPEQEECSEWKAYAKFQTPVSLELATQAFANKLGQPAVSVVACYEKFEKVSTHPRWTNWSVEDFM